MRHLVGRKRTTEVIQALKNGVIVSCQAPEDSPINHPLVISAMALVAEQQGAVAVRINGARNIRAVRRRVKIPIIGIEKLRVPGCSVYITPHLASARRVLRAGADIIAMDFTGGQRPGGQSAGEIVQELKQRSNVVVMADVATLEQGRKAQELGADLVATTLFGYTETTKQFCGPGFKLLRDLVRELSVPIILEGRVRSAVDVQKGFDLGAHAIVAGTAVTDIEWLVRRLVAAVPRRRRGMARVEVE
ncbi:MAG: N-acetylmannosamine-6-phosphate 2-epimerase [Acidobacteriia bacterium]|nr:N-acetylmannosamine-6-phosphate 2-epimerase [Terriglobia bacterium]